jgi:cobalt-precorrin-5B (C1)-methyltransferase
MSLGKKEQENMDKDLELAEQEQEIPEEIERKREIGKLRTGYTTGTSAAAAAKGALSALITGSTIDRVRISLPKQKTAELNIAWTKLKPSVSATCGVIKDAGDDPDVTHGAEICATVSFTDQAGTIAIEGGMGVGRVTKPGLGLNIGQAAINSVPTKMIEQAVEELALKQLNKRGISVIISVPRGEEIAKKTDNPRLGIIGGISILGTTGIVVPYSTASFAASIRQSLDVAVAMGSDTVVLTTGGRSEDFAKELFRRLMPEHSFVQMGDFAGYSIKQCANKKVRKAIIAGFIGKLTKMAMGVKQTHVKGSNVSMEFLAQVAQECTSSLSIIAEVKNANTARHVSEIIDNKSVTGFYNRLCKKVCEQMQEYSGGKLQLEVIMFRFDGNIYGKYGTHKI